jgi:hypothetical protein
VLRVSGAGRHAAASGGLWEDPADRTEPIAASSARALDSGSTQDSPGGAAKKVPRSRRQQNRDLRGRPWWWWWSNGTPHPEVQKHGLPPWRGAGTGHRDLTTGRRSRKAVACPAGIEPATYGFNQRAPEEPEVSTSGGGSNSAPGIGADPSSCWRKSSACCGCAEAAISSSTRNARRGVRCADAVRARRPSARGGRRWPGWRPLRVAEKLTLAELRVAGHPHPLRGRPLLSHPGVGQIQLNLNPA